MLRGGAAPAILSSVQPSRQDLCDNVSGQIQNLLSERA
jgi:hypothetical protein